MLAEVISIGDELTSGQRLDTNSRWLSQRLGELGIRVGYHTTVADDLDANVRVFRQAVERADLVIATGGLGPTADDLTREALAELTGRPLVLDEGSLAHIRGLFARRQRPMPERNVVQAMFPEGSRVIPNPHGSAPGIDLDVPPPLGRPSRVLALPGVPAEMVEMWSASLAPMLGEISGPGRIIRHEQVRCFGVGESDLEQMLPDLIRRGRVPPVGITVSDATITLRITAEGSSQDECQQAIGPTVEIINQCLGSLVFGHGDDELEHAVARLLARSQVTLATAEWGTAGLIAKWLGELELARSHYLGGFIASTPLAVQSSLDISGALFEESTELQPAGATAAVAGAMAQACRRRMNADWGLAVGRFPEFNPGAAVPARLYFALAHGKGEIVRDSAFTGHPAILKPRAAKLALNLLRLALLGEESV